MAAHIILPISYVGYRLGKAILNRKIEKKIREAIEEARLEAISEATKTGIKIIKEKSYDWLVNKIAEGLVIASPIALLKLELIEEKTTGIACTVLFLLVMLSKIGSYLDHIKLISGVVRREGFSIKKVAASMIYENVYQEVSSRFFKETDSFATRAAIFFSKFNRSDLADLVASSVADVAANVTPYRILVGSITATIGTMLGFLAYTLFYSSVISPYLF